MRKKLWRGSLVAAIAVACFALLWLGGMDRKRLLDRSTLITSVQGWGLQRPDIYFTARLYSILSGGAQYQWVGNKQILFFHDLAPIQLTAASLNWPASVGTPTLYDVATHREHPLPKLTEFFRRDGGEAKTATVSPDGTHMLWRDRKDHAHCAKLDGSRHMSIDISGDLAAFWAMDSKRFYSCGWGNDELQNNVLVVRMWDVNGREYLDQIQFDQPTGYDSSEDCVPMPNGSLATHSYRLAPEKLKLYTVAPSPTSVEHAVRPKLPTGAEVQALFYSPRGDRLAWIINRTVPDKFAVLHRWIPQYKPTPQKTTALWVSGTLGENLHEIGHIPITEHGRQFYLLDYVRWQPDGKMLSFVSNDTLYTVPAD